MSLRATCVLGAMLALSACRQPAPAGADSATPAAEAPSPAADAKPAATPEAAPNPDQPALAVTTVDGKRFDLAERRGKWVVVNFWATWCSPCLAEMPELSALDAMREHIEVVGLAYEEIEPAAMQAFLKEHPVAYPIAVLDVYDPPKDFAAPRGLPVTYLIAPDGKVAKQFLGPVTAKDIDAAVAAAGGPKAG